MRRYRVFFPETNERKIFDRLQSAVWYILTKSAESVPPTMILQAETITPENWQTFLMADIEIADISGQEIRFS